MDTFVKKVNDFFNSYKAIVILSGIGTIFAIIELVSFFFFGMEINGISFIDAKENTILLVLTLFLVILSLVSLYLGFFVGIANTRGSKYASELTFAIVIIAMILDTFAGLWLVVIELSIAMALAFYRKGFWAKERYKEEKFKLSRMWPLVVLVGIASFVLFFGIVALWGEELYSLSLYPGEVGSNAERPYVWYLDATVGVMGVLGNVCIIFRWRLAYLWWTIAKAPLIICFAVNGNLIQIFQQAIFIIIDIGTVLAMTHQQKIHKEELHQQKENKNIEII